MRVWRGRGYLDLPYQSRKAELDGHWFSPVPPIKNPCFAGVFLLLDLAQFGLAFSQRSGAWRPRLLGLYSDRCVVVCRSGVGAQVPLPSLVEPSTSALRSRELPCYEGFGLLDCSLDVRFGEIISSKVPSLNWTCHCPVPRPAGRPTLYPLKLGHPFDVQPNELVGLYGCFDCLASQALVLRRRHPLRLARPDAASG